MANAPRVIYEGPTALERLRWRVVLVEKPDANGVIKETRYIELAEASDVDAMGCQRWQQLTMKSAQSTWELVCGAALDLALERTLSGHEKERVR